VNATKLIIFNICVLTLPLACYKNKVKHRGDIKVTGHTYQEDIFPILSTDPLARTLPMILGGAGGEIGLYNPDGTSMSKSDLAALGIVSSEISITNKITGKTIASHKEKSASFWTTVFSWFNKSRKEELSTKNTFIFDTDEHAADFESKLLGKEKDAKKYSHNATGSIEIYRIGNRVIINYGDE